MRAVVLLLVTAFTAIAAFPADAGGGVSSLRELQWLAPDSDRVQALTTMRAECFGAPSGSGDADAAAAGRIVFRSPLLLGGPAAHNRMSCQTCHVNGHDNPDFHIQGLSGAPGTADVTSKLFSKTRGDGVFNPLPIPSLLHISRIERPGEPDRIPGLEVFVHGVIVDEFQGARPARTVFDALLAYVLALDQEACPEPLVVPLRLGDDLDLIRGGAVSVEAAIQRRDTALADFLLISLRDLLGQVKERFELPGLENPRAILADLSHALGGLRDTLATMPAEAAIQAWRLRLDAAEPELRMFESRSLYEPDLVRMRLSEGRTADPGGPDS